MSIAIVQPHFTGSNVSTLATNYWREVDADPSYVVMVDVQRGDAWETGGIFSGKAGALAWAERQDAPCVIAAKRIDCPEWGNVQVQ